MMLAKVFVLVFAVGMAAEKPSESWFAANKFARNVVPVVRTVEAVAQPVVEDRRSSRAIANDITKLLIAVQNGTSVAGDSKTLLESISSNVTAMSTQAATVNIEWQNAFLEYKQQLQAQNQLVLDKIQESTEILVNSITVVAGPSAGLNNLVAQTEQIVDILNKIYQSIGFEGPAL